ncbi:MAG: mechanosensitive ion channel [Victivallales bacterium]|nr:mechanosensitive ion channel [Victivallales bacterium]
MLDIAGVLVEEAMARLLEFYPRISTSLLILLCTFLASFVIRKSIMALASRNMLSGQKMEISKLLATAAATTVLVIGVISALGTLGVNVSALIAGLGLSGFALGFALRDALSNLLSGILIILYQPFKIGDQIVVAGSEGKVSEINLRYTILKSDDNRFLIPNANLFNNIVTVRRKPKPEPNKPAKSENVKLP